MNLARVSNAFHMKLLAWGKLWSFLREFWNSTGWEISFQRHLQMMMPWTWWPLQLSGSAHLNLVTAKIALSCVSLSWICTDVSLAKSFELSTSTVRQFEPFFRTSGRPKQYSSIMRPKIVWNTCLSFFIVIISVITFKAVTVLTLNWGKS